MSGGVNASAGLDDVSEAPNGEGELQHFGSICNAVAAPVDDNVGHVLVSAASELTGKAQTCRKCFASA